MENTKKLIKSDKQLLLTKLFQYGSREKKRKQYSCIHCNSSDALSLKENTDGTYIYHCFSCGKTGDVINLVQKKEGIEFYQAVKLLADEKGLIVPKSNTSFNTNFESNKKKYNPLLQDIKKYKIDELLSFQEELLKNKNIDMIKIFQIDEEIKKIKRHDYRFSKEEYKRLINLIKIKKDTENIITIENTLDERYEDIKFILNQEGLNLIEAPTGSGKTYTIIKAFKELSKEFSNRIFIILCPNRVQNEQNGKEYGVYVVVGGVNTEQHITVMSCVYEKIDEVIKAYRSKDITLVVDEAHELIESTSYRKKAIDLIDLSVEKCYNTIHLTATSRKLKEFYNYNNKYTFNFKEAKNNLDNLNIIPSKDLDKTLFTLLKINKMNNKKSLVFMSGSKNDLKTTGDVLKRKGYNVEVITSDDKQTESYLKIVNYSTIAEDVDVVLTTKVLECGTNIKNTDIIPMEVVKNPNHFNLDSTEQKFARLRAKNGIGYLILKEPKENKGIRSFDEIKEELMNISLGSMKGIEALKGTQKNISIEDYIGIINESIKNYISAITGISGVLDFDEESLMVTINKKNLINRAFKDYDKQFLYNLDLLCASLKGRIKANSITVQSDESIENDMIDFLGISPEDTQLLVEDLKETKKLTKEVKEENSIKAKKTIMELYKNGYLEEYLYSEDKFELLQNFKKYVNETLYNQFKFLLQEEKELLKLEKLFNINVLKEDMKTLMKYYQVMKTVAEVDRLAKKISYLEFNEINPKEIPDLYSSYGAIRNKFDKVKEVQGRVTQKDMLSLVKELHKKKLLWQFDKQRLKEDYEKYLVEKDKAKKEKILGRIINKTIHEIGLIYTLKSDEKGYLISSLK